MGHINAAAPPPPHQIQIVFQQRDHEPDTVLGINPLYDHLDFSGKNISYSAATYAHEKQIAIEHMLTHDGLLPTGNDQGGHFWDYVRWRWETAVKSGHELRFEANHPCVSEWLERDYKDRLPSLPIIPPALPPVLPPILPPVGTVPEPPACLLLGLGMLGAWLARRFWA